MRKKKFWLWAGGVLALVLIGLTVAGIVLSRRFEPFIKEQTVLYLEKRFDSKVELGSLTVSMPMKSPLQVLLNKGRGAQVKVEGRTIALRHRGRTDVPPMFAMDRFLFEVDLHTLWEKPAHVKIVRLEGMALNLPPKGERPTLGGGEAAPEPEAGTGEAPEGTPAVIIDEIIADGTKLTLLPKDETKAPLIFDIHKLKLTTAGPGVAMKYDAELTNAKPPGLIQAKGSFGPWVAGEPSQSAIDGNYVFEKADLGVFKGIAGTLSSKGKFSGVLARMDVEGVTETPDFRLTMGGEAVPLRTEYKAVVDGTNGNTLLEPVIARLGSTVFECRGGVVRGREEIGKSVILDVVMKEGRIDDVLKLAMKGGKPFLTGGVGLKLKFDLPPGQGEVADRLRISGNFDLRDANFTSATVQDKIDEFSRRGQGRPKDEAIEEVPTNLKGTFSMADGVMRFSELFFNIPGADVDLKGRYRFADETLAFRGKMRLEAKVSQTQTGWKRILLKPVDPFFSKQGAGTLLSIQIAGQRANPEFGRDRGIDID
ncbi:MAG: hypothetical protein KJZ79_03595 [Bryobacteraceae bacterium]|nr:hypothetical protein [Bryobacteraceae bacterium]